MTSDFNARSFDRPRERVVPTSFRGYWSDGAEVTVDLHDTTLVVAIKSNCDGCRDFISSNLESLRVPVLVISATDDEPDAWVGALAPVFVSPEAFTAMDIRSAPVYVLLDPATGRVLTEGVLFGPSQVAQEIAPYLALPVHDE